MEELHSEQSHSEAERDLLGALLINNELLGQIDHLRGEHFHEPVHQRIFDVVRQTVQEGDVANPVTLKNRFDKDGALADIGGARYLLQLASGATAIAPVKTLAKLVYNAWQRRQIISWSNNAILEAEHGDMTPEEIAARLASSLNALGSVEKRRRVLDAMDVLEEIVADMKNGVRPYSTGLAKLDECMGGGLFPAKMYGIGARQKVGKTLLASTLAYNLAKQGVRVQFIAGEMGAKEIHRRVLSRQMDVYESSFRNSYSNSADFQSRLLHATEETATLRKFMLYQNAPGLNFDDLKQYMASAVHRFKVQVIILDYWQLVGGKASRDSDAKHLDNVAQWIADFSKDYEIATVVFAQMNQEGNTRGSEGIRKAVDQFYEIHREDLTTGEAWVEMKDTRYTKWMNIGDEGNAGWRLEEKGLYFREV